MPIFSGVVINPPKAHESALIHHFSLESQMYHNNYPVCFYTIYMLIFAMELSNITLDLLSSVVLLIFSCSVYPKSVWLLIMHFSLYTQDGRAYISANPPTISIKACETQAKNLATRIFNYILFLKLLQFVFYPYRCNVQNLYSTYTVRFPNINRYSCAFCNEILSFFCNRSNISCSDSPNS